MAYTTIDLTTFTDADFARSFRQQFTSSGLFVDFTGCTMQLMVRTTPEDAEVFLVLNSSTSGIPVDESGIDIAVGSDGLMSVINVIIAKEDLQNIPEGSYVHSLIVTTPDSIENDLWRGSLIHSVGPTR
jgi:hypothetical protein